MRDEEITEDSWREYPNNTGFHLRCDLALLQRRLMETVDWIMAIPDTGTRVRLLTDLKDGVMRLVNIQGSWYWPGLQQLRYAAIYDHFVAEWKDRARRDKAFAEEFPQYTESTAEEWEEHRGRSWYAAWSMTHITGLNVAQIRRVVENEAARRRHEAEMAVRKHQRAQAESKGIQRPVGTLVEENPDAGS